MVDMYYGEEIAKKLEEANSYITSAADCGDTGDTHEESHHLNKAADILEELVKTGGRKVLEMLRDVYKGRIRVDPPDTKSRLQKRLQEIENELQTA